MITTVEEKTGHSKHAQANPITVGIVQTIPTTLYYSAFARTQRTQGFSITVFLKGLLMSCSKKCCETKAYLLILCTYAFANVFRYFQLWLPGFRQ